MSQWMHFRYFYYLDKQNMWIIVVLFTLFCYSHTATHVQSWPDLIQTDTFVPNTLPTPSSIHSFVLAVSLPTSYKYSLSLSDLFQQYKQDTNRPFGWYEIRITKGNQSGSNFNVRIQSQLFQANSRFAIRYLIVDSSFQYLQIYNFVYSFQAGRMYNDSDAYYPITTPYSVVAGNDSLMTMLNGYDISSTVDMKSRWGMGMLSGSDDQRISLKVDCYIESASNAINCRTVSLLSGFTFNISYVGFDILIARSTQLMNDFNGSTFRNNTARTTNDDLINFNGLQVNNSWLFYGINRLQKNSNNSRPFHFNINPGVNSLAVNLDSNNIVIYSYIYLAVFIDCGSQGFWSTADSICQGCPDGQYLYNNTTPCISCNAYDPQCTQCNSTQCYGCAQDYIINYSGGCDFCSTLITNCQTCNATTNCLTCEGDYISDGASCFLCGDRFTGCNSCNGSSCLACSYPYTLNGNSCQINCGLIAQCLICSLSPADDLICDVCTYGLSFTGGRCQSVCGDGVIGGDEQCDDHNSQNLDGCSSTCQVEDSFTCDNSTGVSQCLLSQMQVIVSSLEKATDKNEVVLTVDLYPKGLPLYESANWLGMFQSYSHDMQAIWVEYDSQTGQLRIGLSYNQALQDQSVSLTANLTLASASINSTLSLSLPSTTSNNEALYVYSDLTYMLAKVVKYVALIIAVLALLLMLAGYFGSKLQSIEAVAVIQLAGLMVVVGDVQGPTYKGLSQLGLALGITDIDGSTGSQNVPSHIGNLLPTSNTISLINIFLLFFFAPLVTSLVLKICSLTCHSDSPRVHRAWKYALASYTYYGLLFLAYGQFAALTLSARYFSSDLSNIVGIIAGLLFTTIYVLWVIGSCKYSAWFGCFKKKFFKFEISQYYYLVQSGERIVTAAVVVCLSPGMIVVAAAAGILTIQAIFIAVKKPYVLREWKRPLFNKIAAVVICLMYLGSTMTGADSMINQMIPLGILAFLAAVIVVAIVSSVYKIKEFWQNQEDKQKVAQKQGSPLSVEEAQAMLMKAFEMKIMPSMAQNASCSFRPFNDQIDINKWKWQNYPILNSNLQFRMEMKERLKEQRQKQSTQSVEKMKMHEQEQTPHNSLSGGKHQLEYQIL